jgi:PEP-CTERM motif
MSFQVRTLAASLAAIGSLFAAGQAFAYEASFSGYAHGSQSVQATVSAPSGGYDALLSAGGFDATFNGASFTSYCIELYEPVSFGETYTNYTPVAGSAHAFMNPNASVDISKLYAQRNVVNDATTEAAFQIAIWELTYETSGNYSLSAGNAKFTGGTAATSGALELATSWLNALPSISMMGGTGRIALSADGSTGYSTLTLESKGLQDQVRAGRVFIDIIAAPVPEPSTYALMAAGLLSAGLVARRRSNRQS